MFASSATNVVSMSSMERAPGEAAGAWRALVLLAAAELMAMSLWFSASAVLPALTREWSLGESARAWMTMSVQLGFVSGALLSGLLNLPDILSPRAVFAASAVGGAIVNAAIPLMSDGSASAVPLRFLTGFFLAGVYPPGLKVMATWFRRRRGLALGVVVGALTVGSALPHLIAVVGSPDWRRTMMTASGLSLAAGLLAATVIREGPYRAPSPRFQWRYAARIWRDPAIRLANFGYLGHMWELYAVWTWLPLFLLESLSVARAGHVRLVAGVAAFAAIAMGGPGSVAAGLVADRYGRTRTTIALLSMSGACCLAAGLLYGGSPAALLALALVWGATIVGDSAQFSTSVTELGDPSYTGTVLTTQIAVGFLLTMIPIRLLPRLVVLGGWPLAFGVLAIGPVLGGLAMWRLRRRPEATRLAGGMR